MMELPAHKKIILFDGVCNLCDGIVQFVIRRDRKDVFRFAPLQSATGKEILHRIGLDPSETDSIVLYEPGRSYHLKSSAALEIASDLGGLYPLFSVFKIVPLSLRNAVYDWVARNRYRWYGKKATCMVPTDAMRMKFLD